MVAAAVRTEPVSAVLGLDAEAVPEHACRLRHLNRDSKAPLRWRHGDLPPKPVTCEDQVCALGLACQHLEAQPKLGALHHGAQRRAVYGVVAVMQGGEAAVAAAAQNVDNMCGAGLQGIDLGGIHAGSPQVAAAGGCHLESAAHGKAAVVHQQAYQLRRGKGVVGGGKALVQLLQGQPLCGTGASSGIHGGRCLKV